MDRVVDLTSVPPLTKDDLRRQLSTILALEESPRADRDQIEKLSLSLVAALAGNKTGICPASVYHFIDDFDVRARDPRYAEKQRADIRAFLEQR